MLLLRDPQVSVTLPVRDTSASESRARRPISSSKFASPSRSLGREFNLISLRSPGRQQEQQAPGRRMRCSQPRVARRAALGAAPPARGAQHPLHRAAPYPVLCVCVWGGGYGGPHPAHSPSAGQGTPLLMHLPAQEPLCRVLH